MKNRFIIVVLFCLIANGVNAGYTGNVGATVEWVKIYNSNTIYFGIVSPVTSLCTVNYFALDSSLSTEIRDRYYSMLLAAKVSKTTVVIGYDSKNADCVGNAIKVHALNLK